MTTNPTWPPSEPDLVGPIRGADDVRDAVTATIDTWSPFYLGILSKRLKAQTRIGGKGQPANPLKPFGRWRNTPTYRAMGTGMPAAFLVTTGATLKDPEVHGTGKVWATWRAQVRVIVFGTTWQQAADMTSWYEKAVLLSCLQHKSLGGVAQATTWAGTAYGVLDHSSSRTIAEATVGLNVKLANVLDVTAGPTEVPATGQAGTSTLATAVDVELTRVPITEPIEG